ncbi:MAG: hypothetical protein K1X28_04125 [Parachlamydiales bacterium]|nr:hypothetical protein [Parachlamydiales bacterium]
MAVEVVAQIPVTSILVPSCLEYIINKKVAKMALSIIENIIDVIFSWIYCPYSFLYLAKLTRVHTFRDGTPMFDCTKNGIANITGTQNNGRITLFATQVFFSIRRNIEYAFSRANRTEYVVVQDDPRARPNWVQVMEQEMKFPDKTKPKEKLWTVNANMSHRFEGQNPLRDFFFAIHI